MIGGALKPGIDEESDQIIFVNWVNRTYPQVARKLHHSPNGGKRDKRTGARMKLMGTKPGFHDLVFFHPVGKYNGLAIEMKIDKGTLSEDRKDWIPIFAGCGFLVAPCWGLDEALTAFKNYMEGKTP